MVSEFGKEKQIYFKWKKKTRLNDENYGIAMAITYHIELSRLACSSSWNLFEICQQATRQHNAQNETKRREENGNKRNFTMKIFSCFHCYFFVCLFVVVVGFVVVGLFQIVFFLYPRQYVNQAERKFHPHIYTHECISNVWLVRFMMVVFVFVCLCVVNTLYHSGVSHSYAWMCFWWIDGNSVKSAAFRLKIVDFINSFVLFILFFFDFGIIVSKLMKNHPAENFLRAHITGSDKFVLVCILFRRTRWWFWVLSHFRAFIFLFAFIAVVFCTHFEFSHRFGACYLYVCTKIAPCRLNTYLFIFIWCL